MSSPVPFGLLDRAEFVDTPRELIARQGERLAALVGRTIEETWVAWDTATDSWFADEPVIVGVGSDAVEVVCWKLSEIAITWGDIDTRVPPRRSPTGQGRTSPWSGDATHFLSFNAPSDGRFAALL